MAQLTDMAAKPQSELYVHSAVEKVTAVDIGKRLLKTNREWGSIFLSISDFLPCVKHWRGTRLGQLPIVGALVGASSLREPYDNRLRDGRKKAQHTLEVVPFSRLNWPQVPFAVLDQKAM